MSASIVTGEKVARFVSDRLGFALCPPYTCMGIERDGAVVAGVIFSCFEGYDVHFTAAGTGWTRTFLKAAGQYVFGQLGCLRVTATTEDDAVVRMACKLGGQIEGRLRDHFGDGRDGVIVGILRRDWKWDRFL